MFLRERVRKLVGVAAPSDLAGSSSMVIESDYMESFIAVKAGT